MIECQSLKLGDVGSELSQEIEQRFVSWRFISRLIDNLKYKTLETLLFENQQGRPVFMFHVAMML